MDLVPYMYYERQEPGSQLCAQHCLNNLLQQHTYSEFDLADIALKLDQAENATLAASQQNKQSYNFDDTGFFSISVLERALQVWDLTLVRWRGEAMKPYQDHPEDQAAFIFNLASHWLPLRRFSPSPPTSSSKKRWYNLNSFLPNGPEWISPTYLRLVLTQAEKEGYSVFVIRRVGDQEKGEGEGWTDGGVGVLPECTADRMSVELGEPQGRSGAGQRLGGNGGAVTDVDQPSVDNTAGPSSRPVLGELSPTAGSGRRRRRQNDPQRDIFDDEEFSNPAHAADSGSRPIESNDQDEEYARAPRDRDEDEFYSGPVDFQHHARSYDDEDADLQAALKASMDDVPKGWVAPVIPEKKMEKKTRAPALAPGPTPVVDETQVELPASGSKFREEMDEDDDDAPTEVLSPEEIRRRRLARFQ
ncbi:Ataxin-3, partial [Tremellales sp. Uapishka_1]